jgi:hypothetical protein
VALKRKGGMTVTPSLDENEAMVTPSLDEKVQPSFDVKDAMVTPSLDVKENWPPV